MKEFLEAYRKNDPAAKSIFEIFFLYPGPKAILFHRVAHGLYGMGFFFLARFVSELSRGLTGIEIHPGALLGRNLVIDHGMGVVIGETAQVGDNCLIYQGVTLGGVSLTAVKRHPTLGNGVTIGAGAKVLGPIELGDGCKVGANAVVTKSASAGATLVGIPAKEV